MVRPEKESIWSGIEEALTRLSELSPQDVENCDAECAAVLESLSALSMGNHGSRTLAYAYANQADAIRGQVAATKNAWCAFLNRTLTHMEQAGVDVPVVFGVQAFLDRFEAVEFDALRARFQILISIAGP